MFEGLVEEARLGNGVDRLQEGVIKCPVTGTILGAPGIGHCGI